MANDPDSLDFASGVLMDVTQLRLVRAQLEVTQWERSLLMDSMVEPFIFFGTDQKLKWCNRAAENYLNRTLAELSGTSCKNLFCDTPSACDDCPVEKAEKSGAEASAIRTLADGITWQINVRPLHDHSDTLQGYSFLCRNISSEVAGEAARRELEAQLLQAQKLESIGRLAGGIAHEFNNLMSPVLGYSELLLDEVPLDPEYKDMILEIKNSAMQASLVTSRLLTFSKKKRPSKKPLLITALLNETVALLRGTLSETIAIHTHYFDDTLQIEFDPTQFQQMILNLAINAQDAMPQGGSLRIEVAHAAESELTALVQHHEESRDWVKISVSDTGEGIAEENLPKVFDPFFTTRDRMRGTGLGLAMVHGVVDQHDGHITVKSTPGEGTLFTIFVPSYNGRNKRDGASGPHQASQGIILLVEDDPSLAKMAQTILRRDNYTVIVAASGHEALEFAMRPSARIDLLITDIVIPDMDGFKIADSLRARIPDLKVLYMSGHTEHIVAHKSLATATEGFIQKPFTLKSFKSKVSTFLPGHIE